MIELSKEEKSATQDYHIPLSLSLAGIYLTSSYFFFGHSNNNLDNYVGRASLLPFDSIN